MGVVEELPVAGDAGEMVDADACEAFQKIGNPRVSLRIKQQIDAEIRNVENGSGRVSRSLHHRTERPTGTERGAGQSFRPAGGLVDGRFPTGWVELDAVVASIEFHFGSLVGLVGADRKGHILGVTLADSPADVVGIGMDFKPAGLEQIPCDATESCHMVDAVVPRPVEEQEIGGLLREGIDLRECGGFVDWLDRCVHDFNGLGVVCRGRGFGRVCGGRFRGHGSAG